MKREFGGIALRLGAKGLERIMVDVRQEGRMSVEPT
jgi:hypothetical protein